jgi:hypothetical protein
LPTEREIVKSKTNPAKPNPKAVTALAGEPGDDKATIIAKTLTRPSVQAALTIQEFVDRGCKTGLTVDALADELQRQCNNAASGNLHREEGMLAAQAHTLDALFNELARRAVGQECMAYRETYLRLALKAQSQCRATVQTLAEVKNPQLVAFVRQANIAAGPQQVNNAPSSAEPSRAREFETEPSKLSGGSNELLPNTGASTLTGGIDPQVEAVGTLDRAEDEGG